MSNLVVIGFDDEATAFDMRAKLAKMQKEYLIEMEDVVVVTKDEKDKIKLHQADLADVQTEIENVILTAPDVDKEEFNDQFKREIAALSKNLTVYVSSNDRALLMSRVLNRGRRLGESTLNPRNPDQA